MTDTVLPTTPAPTTTPSSGTQEHSRYPEAVLHVRAGDDPVLAQLGHDPRSPYVEQFWVSILGPSAVLLLRRIARQLEAHPDGYDIDPYEWALELGLGTRGGKHSPLWRTVDRICRFGLASRNGSHLVVKRHLPPLSMRQAAKLPPHLQSLHHEFPGGPLQPDVISRRRHS